MIRIRPCFLRLFVAVLSFLTVATVALGQAQQENKSYKPVYFQPGKDVVWVPTEQILLDRMLDMAKLTPQDYVIDLGSGDGRTVITAAKRGARALGIEYDPNLVAFSKGKAADASVSDKARFVQGDIFETDFSEGTIITMFLMHDVNLMLRPKLFNLKPGTRIVSNTFTLGEWKEDQSVILDQTSQCMVYCTAFLWIVPAKVGGTWRLPDGEIVFEQSFQMVSGALKAGADIMPIRDGRLNGDQITFGAGKAKYTGRVNGDTIEGTITAGGNTARWSASRVSGPVQSSAK